MPIEVLNPLKTRLVVGPAISGCSDSPVAREVAFLIPAGEVILACDHDKRLDRPPFRIDGLDDCNPFPVSRLG